MSHFTSIEQVEAAFAAARTHEDVGAILRSAQRCRALLGNPDTARDPTSNRRRLVRALNSAAERVSAK